MKFPVASALAALLLAALLGIAEAAEEEGTELPGPPVEEATAPPEDDVTPALAVPVDYDAERIAACANGPAPVLNEVCAVGTECDEDVRVADFIELYNPGVEPVDLSCFVLVGDEGVAFVGRGPLAPGAIRGWGEGELGWRILKADDEVRLLRIVPTFDGGSGLLELESLRVDRDRAHSYRSPDGGSWRHRSASEAESVGWGSFGRSNTD